jgi:hypothetical protein
MSKLIYETEHNIYVVTFGKVETVINIQEKVCKLLAETELAFDATKLTMQDIQRVIAFEIARYNVLLTMHNNGCPTVYAEEVNDFAGCIVLDNKDTWYDVDIALDTMQ